MKLDMLCLTMAVLVLSSFSVAADSSWSNWRGPEFNGVAPGCNPPTVWSETQNIKWKTRINGDTSSGSPIVWKDKIFFQTALKVDDAAQSGNAAASAEPTSQPGRNPNNDANKAPTATYKFNLVCMDRNTGKILWETTACEVIPHQNHHPDHGFASFSPVTDGKYIWVFFGSRGMYCFDFDGKLIWKQELPKIKSMFGEAGSPALTDQAVIVVSDSDNEADSGIWAFEKATGTVLWKNKRNEKNSYVTPIIADVGGKKQVITGASVIRSYDAKTGSLIWEAGSAVTHGIPTPIVGFDSVFCTSGSRGSGMVQVIKLYKEAIAPADANSVIWQTKNVAPQVASPLLYGQRLYVYSISPSSLSCFDAKTGAPFYEKQPLDQFKDKNAYASPVGAADRVYMTGRNGVTYVVKHADRFEVLAVNQLQDVIDGTPAFVDDEIIIKGKQSVYCISQAK